MVNVCKDLKLVLEHQLKPQLGQNATKELEACFKLNLKKLLMFMKLGKISIWLLAPKLSWTLNAESTNLHQTLRDSQRMDA